MPSPAAIGFRAHSGWAAAAAVAGPLDSPAVILRRRIEMIDRGTAGIAQPYHAAVGLEIAEAGQLIRTCAAHAAALAATALRGVVKDVRQLGYHVCGCGLLLASGKPLPSLERILVSHPLLHTAEGELFRAALRTAIRECEFPLTESRERESPNWQVPASMGKGMGPPWRQDQKLAAAAAWLALKSH